MNDAATPGEFNLRRVLVMGALAWAMFAGLHHEAILGRQKLTMDFASFYFAAKVSLDGENFYEPDVLQRSRADIEDDGHVFPYIYPPILAQWLRPIVAWDAGIASRAWSQLLVFLCAVITTTVAYVGRPRDWAIATMLAVIGGLLLTVGHNIGVVGQVNVILAALLALAFLATRNGHELHAGALLAVAAVIKVTPALIIMLWVAERRWRALLSFVASIVAMVGVSVAMFGITPWRAYLECLQYMSRIGGIPGLLPFANGCFSPTSLLLRLGLSSHVSAALSLVLTCCLLAPVMTLAQQARHRSSAAVFLMTCCVVLLASPYVWHHHLVFLWPAFSMVAEECRAQERQTLLLLLLAIGAFCAVDWPRFYGAFGIGSNPFGRTLPLLALLVLYFVGLQLALLSQRRVAVAAPPSGRGA